MSVVSVGLGAMFAWISGSFRLLGRNFAGLLMASLVSLLLVILMCLPLWLYLASMLPAAGGSGFPPASGLPAGGDLTMLLVAYGATLGIFLLLFPPFMVGWFRLLHGIDRGQHMKGTDILRPYGDPGLWWRSLRFGLLALGIYVLVFAALGLAFSGVIMEFIRQVAEQQAATLAGAPPAPPEFPGGLILAYFLFLAISTLLQFGYFLGFTEVALRSTSALGALKLAAEGLLRNAIKLLVFVFVLFLLLMVVMMLVGIVLGILITLLALVNPMLSVVVAALIYVPVMLLVYPLMFAGHYLAWKDILADGQGDLDDAAAAGADDGSAFAA